LNLKRDRISLYERGRTIMIKFSALTFRFVCLVKWQTKLSGRIYSVVRSTAH